MFVLGIKKMTQRYLSGGGAVKFSKRLPEHWLNKKNGTLTIYTVIYILSNAVETFILNIYIDKLVTLGRLLPGHSVHSAASLQRDDIPTNQWPRYDIQQSDGEAPLILVLWGMRSTSSLHSIPGLLWPEMVAPDRALSMGQIDLFDI